MQIRKIIALAVLALTVSVAVGTPARACDGAKDSSSSEKKTDGK